MVTLAESIHFPTKSTTYLTQITIPSGKKLSTVNKSEGNFKVALTGTPVAGVFLNAAQSVEFKIFCKLIESAEFKITEARKTTEVKIKSQQGAECQ